VRRRSTGLVVSVVTTPTGRRAAAGLARWLESVAPGRARGAMTVALVTDARMRVLNRTFRKVDAATDVLSFPAEPAGRGPEREGPGAGRSRRRDRAGTLASGLVNQLTIKSLGDVAIAIGVARRQAKVEGHGLRTEVRILALHGLLHLLGYDHERDQGAMRRIEERLRRQSGLPAGLIARSPRLAHR